MLGALSDFLLGMGNRSGMNVLVSNGGNLCLIDNEDRLFSPQSHSVFLPATKWYRAELDYRCAWQKKGIGISYPSQFTTCLEKMSHEEWTSISNAYALPSLQIAMGLQNRARHMLASSFEHAMEISLRMKLPRFSGKLCFQ